MRVVIDGIEEIFRRVDSETEKYHQARRYIVMRLVCMRAAGWTDASYEDLMVVSGFASGFAYHPNDLFYAHYHAPAGADDRIARATGFGWEWLRLDDMEGLWGTLKESIDAGKPVHSPFLEEILFMGYQEGTDRSSRLVQPIDLLFVKPGVWWTWSILEKWNKEYGKGRLGRHTERVEIAPEAEIIKETLLTIVELARDDPRRRRKDLAGAEFGLAGIEAYARDIADVTKSGKADEYFHSGWLGCHNIYPQWTGRRMVADYITRAAGSFDEETARHLRDAATSYSSAHSTWLEWERHLGKDAPEGAWTDPHHRTKGAKAVFEALDHEEAGVDALKLALHSC